VRRVSVLELKSCLDGCPLVAISLSNDKETKALAEAFWRLPFVG
jgi:hypothetical protein